MPEIVHNQRSIVYTLKRSRRRSVALRVDPTGAVTVLAPRMTIDSYIQRVVQSRADWIVERLRDVEEYHRRYPSKAFVEGESFPVWGQDVHLEVVHHAHQVVPSCELVDGRLKVHVNGVSGEALATHIRQTLQSWYTSQLEVYLPEQIKRYAQRLGVTVGRVKVANQRHRWASCSRQGNIRFNWRLTALPPSIIDYVVAHELSHIRSHDHSPRFWSVVQSVMPDYKERRRWLRKNRLTF